MGAAKSQETKSIHCSFCGRNQDNVRRLVAGQEKGVFICNDCIELCTDLLKEEGTHTESIAADSQAKLIADIGILEENVRQSIDAVMENRLTASHLVSDVHMLLAYLDKLKNTLLASRSDTTT